MDGTVMRTSVHHGGRYESLGEAMAALEVARGLLNVASGHVILPAGDGAREPYVMARVSDDRGDVERAVDVGYLPEALDGTKEPVAMSLGDVYGALEGEPGWGPWERTRLGVYAHARWALDAHSWDFDDRDGTTWRAFVEPWGDGRWSAGAFMESQAGHFMKDTVTLDGRFGLQPSQGDAVAAAVVLADLVACGWDGMGRPHDAQEGKDVRMELTFSRLTVARVEVNVPVDVVANGDVEEWAYDWFDEHGDEVTFGHDGLDVEFEDASECRGTWNPAADVASLRNDVATGRSAATVVAQEERGER